ncbi:ABC transporter ATP-binding protein [Spiribacter halobius]|uniref:ABC transporter n=1 Tax=Sediminicurvatus halobius TaxID=2182432 RepID=A0A2U2N0I9_9GAMM|nr:ABC transporter ATP-binding protein [Spiribacter halobius]PWG62582.1 ABC transporter [Spiribacter halobius]UEX78502.1 ABC transporter ATP-binding protein [Spiribacter halobius]
MSLVLEGVSRRVDGELHIDDISLTCERAGFNVLLGLTEAGKTTLMRLMAGLDRPTTGRVLEDGRDVTHVPVRRRGVAMVYQQFINYPSLTVYDNIASPLKLAGLARSEIEQRVRREAERLHIEHLLNRLPAELSGGQQQRTAMARALVRDASLVLLDEPLVNLDYKLREELRSELRDIFEDRDAVVVYATTDPQEALVLGGRTAVLHEGKLVQHGPTPHVYRHPASTTVAQVFADPPMNLIGARLDDGELRIGDAARVPAPAHFGGLPAGHYEIGIRPTHLSLDAAGAAITLNGEVEVAEIAGSVTFVHLAVGGRDWVVEEAGVHPLELGSAVTIAAEPSRLYAFDANGRLAAAPES